jgi:surface carbohydrate biosynthesis protein
MSPSEISARPRIVLLVDDKKRDLAGVTLIAHQLDRQGVDCILEPLEAFRAVLAAYRPAMVIFNHLSASHLVDWSKRLARMGVLVGVLPNEGIAYDLDQLRFGAQRHHSGAHIDYFFCWNGVHRGALLEAGVGERARVELVGVPRFDFYFEPYSRAFRPERTTPRERQKILLCTNFAFAKFRDLPPIQASLRQPRRHPDGCRLAVAQWKRDFRKRCSHCDDQGP